MDTMNDDTPVSQTPQASQVSSRPQNVNQTTSQVSDQSRVAGQPPLDPPRVHDRQHSPHHDRNQSLPTVALRRDNSLYQPHARPSRAATYVRPAVYRGQNGAPTALPSQPGRGALGLKIPGDAATPDIASPAGSIPPGTPASVVPGDEQLYIASGQHAPISIPQLGDSASSPYTAQPPQGFNGVHIPSQAQAPVQAPEMPQRSVSGPAQTQKQQLKQVKSGEPKTPSEYALHILFTQVCL